MLSPKSLLASCAVLAAPVSGLNYMNDVNNLTTQNESFIQKLQAPKKQGNFIPGQHTMYEYKQSYHGWFRWFYGLATGLMFLSFIGLIAVAAHTTMNRRGSISADQMRNEMLYWCAGILAYFILCCWLYSYFLGPYFHKHHFAQQAVWARNAGQSPADVKALEDQAKNAEQNLAYIPVVSEFGKATGDAYTGMKNGVYEFGKPCFDAIDETYKECRKYRTFTWFFFFCIWGGLCMCCYYLYWCLENTQMTAQEQDTYKNRAQIAAGVCILCGCVLAFWAFRIFYATYCSDEARRAAREAQFLAPKK